MNYNCHLFRTSFGRSLRMLGVALGALAVSSLSLHAQGTSEKASPSILDPIHADLASGAGVYYTLSDSDSTSLAGYAALNKSTSSGAIQYTSQRTLCRTSAGTLHEVFESGGQIFYRNLSSGTTCQLTSGTANNRAPCITLGDSSTLYILWQTQIDSSSWKVYYARSKNRGSSWTTKALTDTAFACVSPGPLPSITAASKGYALLSYRKAAGLATMRSLDTGATWISTAALSGTSSSSCCPTVGTDSYSTWQTYYKAQLAFQGQDSSSLPAIYYNFYDFSAGTWGTTTKISSVLPGSTYHNYANPSLAASENTQTVHVVWDAVDSSNAGGRVIVHRYGTLGSFGSSYTVLHYQSELKPQISNTSDAAAWMVYQNASGSGIWKRYFNGTGWGSGTYVSAGFNPQISVGSTTLKYLWTTGSSSPYLINVSSEALSKADEESDLSYTRALNVIDPSSGSSATIELSSPVIRHKDGSSTSIGFASTPAAAGALELASLIDAGSSGVLPTLDTGDTLVVTFGVCGSDLSRLFAEGATMELELESGSNAVLSLKSVKAAECNTTMLLREIALPVSASVGRTLTQASGTGLTVRPVFKGLSRTDGLSFSLGHTYRPATEMAASENVALSGEESGTTPTGFALMGNYPNPFNPSTTIQFALPATSNVRLVIYDILGREIAVPVNGSFEAGTHAVVWDTRSAGHNVASGVYFARLEVNNSNGNRVFTGTTKMVLAK